MQPIETGSETTNRPTLGVPGRTKHVSLSTLIREIVRVLMSPFAWVNSTFGFCPAASAPVAVAAAATAVASTRARGRVTLREVCTPAASVSGAEVFGKPPDAGSAGGTANEKEAFMATTDIWTYRDTDLTTGNYVGYGVEALDGSIGKIDEATHDVGAQLHRRRHGPVDLRQEGHAPRRRDQPRRPRRREGLREPHEGSDQGRAGVRRRPLSRRHRTAGELGSYYGTGGAGYREW